MSRRRVPSGPLLAGLFALGLFAVALLPGPTFGENATRQQQIAELERQIAEMTRRLEELRKTPTTSAAAAPALPEGVLPEAWVKQLNWRSVGPATMGGRITALSVYEADPNIWWVATASGGLLKTTNNGTTFTHQFDREATVSVGDVCVAPSNPSIVWVGTGEANPRNSVSYGDGVYKSTDGGEKWTNVGLKKSFQIGRVVVHPKNPNVVYVGALGRLYGPNEERGVFKTTNGGETWEKVFYLDDRTGIIDLVLDPSNPETLYAAAWERMRDGFDSHPGTEPMEDGYDGYDPIKKWGKKGGIYKSVDGGKSWNKLAKGLPTCATGRIGLDIYRKNPKTLFAIIDTEMIGMGSPPPPAGYLGAGTQDGDDGAKVIQIVPNSPAAKAGMQLNDIIKSIGGKEVTNAGQVRDALQGRLAGQKVAVVILRDKETKTLDVTLEPQPEQAQGVTMGLSIEAIEDVGLKVTAVTPQGPGEKAGIKVGDVVKSFESTEVKELRQLVELVRQKKAGDKVIFKLQRDKDIKDFTMTLEPGRGPRTSPRRPNGFLYGGQRENVQDTQGANGHQYGGVYKSTDGGESWTRINSVNPRPMYFSLVRVDPNDENHLFVGGVSLYRSRDGGKTFKADGSGSLPPDLFGRRANQVHDDQHALWIDPRDGRRVIVGTDGGFYVSHDRGDNWDHYNHFALGQFYHVSVDSRKPYRVMGGLQDNNTWVGPSMSLSGQGVMNDEWINLGGGDGFVCRPDPTDPDLIYFESQDGAMQRRNLRTGESRGIRPSAGPGGAAGGEGGPRGGGPRGGGGGFGGGPRYRFNWNTPFILSSHNPSIFYAGGEVVFRSVKRGDDLKPISPDLTRTKRGSMSALAESPRNADVLWAGTDDGALWVTKDGGKTWTNVTDKVGLPAPRWVSTIEASRFREGRAYVCFDGHRSDDDEPYVYVTEDFGQTWKSLRNNLPWGSTRCVREDVSNANLLYCGTEFGIWTSINRGDTWTKINNNLPTVAVHEIAVHPTAGEIVAATHGRSLWILDVAALRQMKVSTLKAKATLFEPNTFVRWRSEPRKNAPIGPGVRRFHGGNPPRDAQILYALGEKAEKASLKILDYQGKTVREYKAETKPGLHRQAWDLTRLALQNPLEAGPGGQPQMFQQPVEAGRYRIVLSVDGKEETASIRVERDPTSPEALTLEEVEEMRPKRAKELERHDD